MRWLKYRSFKVVLATATCLLGHVVAWTPKSPSPDMSPLDAVFQQLVALRMSNYMAAFEYTSPEYKDLPEIQNEVYNYMWVLGENFYPLLHTAHWYSSLMEQKKNQARVVSYIVTQEGEYRGVFWNLSKQKSGNFTNCWLTDSMKTEQTPDDILPRKSFTPKDVVNIVLMFMRYKDKEGYDAAYRFFSQESGAMLSRAEFDTMMDTHTEITEYTTVSIIRQMSDTAVESVLLNAKNEVTTVQWTLAKGSSRLCDGSECWLIESMHRLGFSVEQDFSRMASRIAGGGHRGVGGKIIDIVSRHPLIQFAIFCAFAALCNALAKSVIIPTYDWTKGKINGRSHTKYTRITNVWLSPPSSAIQDAAPLMELTPTPSEL